MANNEAYFALLRRHLNKHYGLCFSNAYLFNVSAHLPKEQPVDGEPHLARCATAAAKRRLRRFAAAADQLGLHAQPPLGFAHPQGPLGSAHSDAAQRLVHFKAALSSGLCCLYFGDVPTTQLSDRPLPIVICVDLVLNQAKVDGAGDSVGFCKLSHFLSGIT